MLQIFLKISDFYSNNLYINRLSSENWTFKTEQFWMVAKKYQKWTQTDGEISFIASSLRIYWIHF